MEPGLGPVFPVVETSPYEGSNRPVLPFWSIFAITGLLLLVSPQVPDILNTVIVITKKFQKKIEIKIVGRAFRSYQNRFPRYK